VTRRNNGNDQRRIAPITAAVSPPPEACQSGLASSAGRPVLIPGSTAIEAPQESTPDAVCVARQARRPSARDRVRHSDAESQIG